MQLNKSSQDFFMDNHDSSGLAPRSLRDRDSSNGHTVKKQPDSQPIGMANHIHDEESLKQIINRLSRIEGHIRGIKTMVRESRPCPEVLHQIAAVRGAISSLARIILDEHLEECLTRAAKEGNIEVEIKELKAALDRFLP